MRPPDRRITLGLYRTRHSRGILEAALDLGIRDLDTAHNYADFASLTLLAGVAADLLPQFFLSTKVGFFPSPTGHTEHSLDPARLREAMETTAESLGRAPDVVFLHNPERSIRQGPHRAAHDLLAAACDVMRDAARSGLCVEWGISTWDPRSLVRVLDHGRGLPASPAHLMHRSGVLAGAAVVEASETLADLLDVAPEQRWGMSPFAGDTRAPFWDTVNLAPLLSSPGHHSTVETAFRLAYELPQVGRVAVSANDPEHLRQLVEATRLDVDRAAADRYRSLLRARRLPKPKALLSR
ncbi:hypothetical protein ACG83_25995 [Frankia sp. R43]|uniref:aldo/keto reductase n=1 Tax=Frankia sp. R43 TaxID=269536 RepID=UPI0006CA5D7B|nr:aldo/keto reductase [Frankia sp. R43]KPM52888.1 hypothetical protein ACG83_25995 [Frankia sp. R43]